MDVVGSTALGQRLDPEDMHQVMDDVLMRSTSIVESRQGRVLQYAGDSLLAVFGSDHASEDDPERAVRVGLSLVEEGRRWSEHVRRQYGHAGFDVRVGIHTGTVLLGGGVDSEGNVRGVNVHIAARM
jgi:class 3 adenylate cyclase